MEMSVPAPNNLEDAAALNPVVPVVELAGQPELDPINHELLHTDFETLLKAHADKDRQSWKLQVNSAMRMLHRRGLATPAHLVALGRKQFNSYKVDASKQASKDRVTALMEQLGLSDIWVDHPQISDIVPYCELSDVTVEATNTTLPSFNFSRLTVPALADLPNEAIAAQMYQATPDDRRIFELRRDIRNYTTAFEAEKERYQAALRGETSAPHKEPSDLDRDVTELLREIAPDGDSGSKNLSGRAASVLGYLGATSPRSVLAIGRDKVVDAHNAGPRVVERITQMLGNVGLAEVWQGNPTMEDIIPYCGLKDIPASTIGVRLPYALKKMSVGDLIDSSATEIAALTEDRHEGRDHITAFKIRERVRAYAIDFMYAKAVQDGTIQPHPNLATES